MTITYSITVPRNLLGDETELLRYIQNRLPAAKIPSLLISASDNNGLVLQFSHDYPSPLDSIPHIITFFNSTEAIEP